jgi:hypothetical protein
MKILSVSDGLEGSLVNSSGLVDTFLLLNFDFHLIFD